MYIISYYVKRLNYYVKKLGCLVYEVCELVYTTSYYLNARLVLSIQCIIMAKDCVIMLKCGVESICCLVQLRGVVLKNLRMRHNVDKTTHEFAIILGMFKMNCLLSSSSISTWGTIKTNTYTMVYKCTC